MRVFEGEVGDGCIKSCNDAEANIMEGMCVGSMEMKGGADVFIGRLRKSLFLVRVGWAIAWF